MDSLDTNFNGKAIDPAVKYAGYEGYERGLSEMLTSFYDAFPQYQGRVALVDLKALEENREAEIARLSEELGVTDLETAVDDKIKDGRMFSGVNDAGEKIAVAAAWNVHTADPSDLTYEQNFSLVRVAVHELAHTIDYMEGTIELDGVLESNYVESYADSYRVAMSVLHGHNDDMLRGLVAGYDNRQTTGVADRYDNGVALAETYLSAQRVAKELGVTEGTPDFSFKHWKEAKGIVDTVRSDNMERHSGEEIPYEKLRYDRSTRREIVGKIKTLMYSGIEEKAPHIYARDDEKEVEAFEDRVEHFVDRLDVRAYEDGMLDNLDEKTLLQVEIAYEARKELNTWLEERVDYIPSADRMLAAYDYLSGQGTFLDYKVPDFDPSVFFAKSLSMYIEHGDDADLDIAYSTFDVMEVMPEYEGTVFQDKEPSEVVEIFTKNPEALQALAGGYTLDFALSRIADEPEVLQQENNTDLENMSTGLRM
ncbi:MAG: hypothetical protein ACRBCK_06870 [Alphaproteobacteria bacterium]